MRRRKFSVIPSNTFGIIRFSIDGIQIINLSLCVGRRAKSLVGALPVAPYGGNFAATKTAAKVLQAGFYWPTFFMMLMLWRKDVISVRGTGISQRRTR